MRVGIKDVAKISGVAVSTASMALSDSSEINENTKLRVKSVAKQLGYVPNGIARKLVSGKSKTIGLISSMIKGISYFPECCSSIEETASRKGYKIITCHSDGTEKKLLDHFELLLELQVDGIIMEMWRPAYGEWCLEKLKAILEKGVKIVGTAPDLNDFNIDVVLYNAGKGASLALEHLIQIGHRNIAFIAANGTGDYEAAKESAYQDTLARHNIPYRPSLTESDTPTVEGGCRAMRKILDVKKDVTAIFAVTDLMAIGAMKVITEAGMKIPESMAVAGFDNMKALIPFAPVPLTTVEPAKHEMGKTLCELLIDRIENQNSHFSPEKIILEPELIIRESTIGKQ